MEYSIAVIFIINMLCYSRWRSSRFYVVQFLWIVKIFFCFCCKLLLCWKSEFYQHS